MAKATKKKAPAPTARPLTFTGLADSSRYHANRFGISWGIYDFVLSIQEIYESGEGDGSVVCQETARIFFSPAHAKALSELLAAHVASYEETHGELPVSEGD